MAQSAVIHEEFAYAGHNAVINVVCYNRLHDCFVSCDDANLRLWTPTKHASDLRIVALPPRTSNFIQAIGFVDARQLYVVSALDGTLKIFDLELNEITSVCTGRCAILSLVFDSKHGKLFSGGVDGCGAWHVRGKPLVGPESSLNTLYELAAAPGFFHHTKLAPPSKASVIVVAAGSNAGSPRKSTTMPQLQPVPKPPPTGCTKRAVRANELTWIQSVQLNCEQTRLYAHGKHRVDVFNTADGLHLDTYTDMFPQENGAITAFVVHEKTQYIVCGCINGCIFVLSVHPTSIVHVFKDHTMAVTGLMVHLSSRLIISSSLDGTVRLWDLEARRQTHRLDIRQPVYALGLLAPIANPCRFYCRTRSTVKIFTIRSAAKEHLASLSPISVLQRVHFPTATTVKSPDTVIPGEKLSSTRHISLVLPSTKEIVDEQEEATEIPTQWIVAAGTDRTIRLYSGRTANEAPSFTWIPEEHALDVGGFSLHPMGKKLFVLLDSQKILIVDIHKKTGEGEIGDLDRRRTHRLVDMDAAPLSIIGATAPTTQQSPPPMKKTLSLLAEAAGEKGSSSTSHRMSGGGLNTSTNTATNPALRGAVRSICCCYYPPIFRSASTGVAGSGDASTQLKWFSRTFVNRRQQSKRDLKKLEDLTVATANTGSTSPTRDGATPLIQSDREWVVCGTEYGHLVFWHSGLTNSFQEAISLDAHDASVVAIAASASSPLCVSLDASKRVHVWQFQPLFTLRQMVELNDPPTCFVLSPTSELLLTGYEDGSVVLMNVSDSLGQVETYNGTEESHDAMISGADFLDAKLIVLTASVDAVVKIWDQQKNLLRQIQIAMALTCLCFMNDDGDVMAGVPTGIFMLPKEDLLPEKLPVHPANELCALPSSREKKLPFWLGGEDGITAEQSTKQDSERAPESLKPGVMSTSSAGPKGRFLFQKKVAVKFLEEPSTEIDDADCDAEIEAASIEKDAKVALPSPRQLVWKRKSNLQSLEVLMGGAGVDPAASPLKSLQQPVLRPVNTSRQSNQRTTPPTSRPPSSRTLFPGKDPDWREVIMPSSPFHNNAPDFSGRNRRRKPPSADSVIISELKMLAHVSHTRATSPRKPGSRPQPDEKPESLGIGRPDKAASPLQYCKHQAPVPPKAKTPRKLWNAIGGEDRRLIAVQRNLPSLQH